MESALIVIQVSQNGEHCVIIVGGGALIDPVKRWLSETARPGGWGGGWGGITLSLLA